MRFWPIAFCLAFPALTATAEIAQSAATRTAKPKQPIAVAAVPPVIKDLPVRKVVLYKSGVGYFEHAGQVTGNQRVTIDFTSPQLNDVLQSLTVLDDGGGRIAGVNYNSTTPLAEQLRSLSLGMGEDPTSTELFQALRGQRVEVTGVPGGPIAGRLMSIETRTEKLGASDNSTTIDKFFLTLVATSGAVRVIELTPAVGVRPVDFSLQGQMDRYLELLSTTHSTGLRHLTLDAFGQGQRQLRVGYISEVPVWKVTYRMVFPHEANGSATLQGWAVVDNTVGADWDNVQLALVAGAPQSFIQPLSQPLYSRRPEIPIATEAQFTPQTHEAAESAAMQADDAKEALGSPKSEGRDLKSKYLAAPAATSVAGQGLGGTAYGFAKRADIAASPAMNGVYRVTDALAEGDVSTSAFDDFFEYALTQPVTIHKNESAMVPILQQEVPAEHVTLWSERQRSALRAIWLENKSSLTLDSGSFSIFENGEFAGEGLFNPIHPGEKRLLSYAADQAVRVRVTDRRGERGLRHVQIHKDVIVETYMDVASVTYSATNSADLDRTLLLEHPRRNNGWSLDDGVTAAETAPDLYRFRLPVSAHSTTKLEVRERGPEHIRVVLDPRQDTTGYLVELVKRVPSAELQLRPVIDAEVRIADLQQQIEESRKQVETAAADEARARENLAALKGNDAARRFVTELDQAEDRLQAERKHTVDLERQKSEAEDRLAELISALSFDWDVAAKS